MLNLNEYIIEKLHIDKDSKVKIIKGVSLHDLIDNYFGTVDDTDTFEMNDALWLFNGCEQDDNAWVFKSYDDWFKYFHKHEDDLITIKYADLGNVNEIYFELPELNNECHWDVTWTEDEIKQFIKKHERTN